MRWIKVAFVSLVLLSALVACGTSDAPGRAAGAVLDETPPPGAVEAARATADRLASELMATLFRELEAGDPAAAIDVCAVRAREMMADYSKQGMTVRRVSRRFRNPANEPDDYEYRKLRELESLHEAGRLPAETADVVSIDGVRTLRYMKPIVLKQPCTMCHGKVAEIDESVQDALHARYPGDRAIGYAVDDLRGAISIKVAL